MSSTAACHCRRRVPAATAAGRLDPAAALSGDAQVAAATAEIETIYNAAQLLRSRADPGASQSLTDRLVELVRSGRFRILE